MALFPLGILSAAGAGGFSSDFDLISTQVLGSDQASITFSSLGGFSSSYKHLQLRIVGRTNGANAFPGIQFNGDTAANYLNHTLQGNGSSVSSSVDLSRTNAVLGPLDYSSSPTNAFGAIVVDILDAFDSTKNTTGRAFAGRNTQPAGASIVSIYSQLWRNTASITSITIVNNFSDSFVTGSRFSLYGIKG